MFEVIPDKVIPEAWRAESIGKDGDVIVVIFSGPSAQHLAWEYANWKNVSQKHAVTSNDPFIGFGKE